MKIVVLDGYTLNPGDNPWSSLEELGEVVIHRGTKDHEKIERLLDADIAVTNKVEISGADMEQLPQLKFIAVTATGFNIVDIEAAKQREIPVSNVPIYGTDSVAQHVFAVLLAFIHRPYAHDQAIRDGVWQERGDFSFCLNRLTELAGRTMGIVGFGRIGRRVGELASAFGMNVIAYNPRPKPEPEFQPFEWTSIENVFGQSDVVSLNSPQTKENTGFVNAALLSTMKPNAILINASRGGLVNEVDLANALNEERIGGACLDVFSAEPIKDDNPLLTAKNCLMTPHYAWATLSARERLMQTTVDNVKAFLSGSPANVVNA